MPLSSSPRVLFFTSLRVCLANPLLDRFARPKGSGKKRLRPGESRSSFAPAAAAPSGPRPCPATPPPPSGGAVEVRYPFTYLSSIRGAFWVLAVAVYDRLCAAGRTSGETAERDPFNGAFGGSGSICVKLILVLACRCSSNSSGRGGVLETAVFIRFSNGMRSSSGRCARRVHVSWLLRLATLAYFRDCGGISRNPFPSAAENNSADI